MTDSDGAFRAAQSATISELVREYETARYDELLRRTSSPIDQITSAEIRTSPDAILTSLAQLATCRTSTERSLISLFDQQRQYIVAEATPTVSIVPNLTQSAHGENLLLCGTSIPRADGVCDYTLCASERKSIRALEKINSNEELPVIVVQDLVTDPRFASSPYCRPGSLFRFYAAVPIRSPRGINIGVLCVINSTPGATWNEGDSKVLRGLAQTIMDHLEGNRLRHLQKRNLQMSLGLQTFIDGKYLSTGGNATLSAPSWQADVVVRSQTELELNVAQSGDQSAEASSNTAMKQLLSTPTPDQSPKTLVTSSANPPSLDDDFNLPQPLKSAGNQLQESSTSEKCFSEAAAVVREALEIDGCAFLSGDSRGFDGVHSREGEQIKATTSRRPPRPGSNAGGDDEVITDLSKRPWLPCQVLGSSFNPHGDSGSSFPIDGRFSQPFLSRLLQQYPTGCIFALDSDKDVDETPPLETGAPTTDDQPTTASTTVADVSPNNHTSMPEPEPRRDYERTDPERREKDILLQTFPNARSVAFVPIWDPQKSCWSIGGFICSNIPNYQFDKHSDLLFLRALGTLAVAEAFRLETAAADRAKSDVLGSLSHELRSPLHGIILGLELLNDLSLNMSQQNIAHMIETCCRTLSDTTEHLLDYSKVNNFTDSKSTQSNELESESSSIPQAGLSKLSQAVHLDVLVEDVLESVYAGYNYQHLSIAQMMNHSKNQSQADVRAIRRMDFMQATEDLNPTGTKNGQFDLKTGDVSIFLLYDPSCSWQFHTLPGAVRRVVMNLFGNSLKYTTHGVIKVSLNQTHSIDPKSKQRIITLIVEDTGIGISQGFLQNEVFKPFSQENRLSTGTGLGLSFVKRITSQLGGRISITSQIGVGTKVTVSLPMTPQTILPTVSESPVNKVESSATTCRGLRALVASSSERGGDGDSIPKGLTEKALMEELCCDYLGMKLDGNPDASQLVPDVVILRDDTTFDSFVPAAAYPEIPSVVVCANALVVHQNESRPNSADQARLHEFVSQPLSPRKLETALSRVLSRWTELQAGLPLQLPLPILPIPSGVYSSMTVPLNPVKSVSESPEAVLATSQEYLAEPQFLLVDDNPINLKILMCFMKKFKQAYRTATNGEEAVNSYKADPGRYVCILMDISMPVMDGLEATRQIRAFERYNNIKESLVLAITGLASESTRDEAVRSGVDFFVTKPAKLKELEAKLKSRGLLL
ncbi:hypothetical protein B0T10DRAFT_280152 [Thelonectria olida]|uniref:histidine kinase n=1 Tax=Thelonectria olida TaxID=1576542 RepID=A0A9P8VQC9_9HYPO|nr:hypothetical protein B0T10DRAFT_280152 [Thelonectria olida]